MIWLRYLPHLLVGLALAVAVYWVSEGRYDAGWRAGDEAGYSRGVRDSQLLHDKAMLTLIAESRAAAAETLKATNDANRETERRQQAEIDSYAWAIKAMAGAVDAQFTRLHERLRAAQRARAQDRVPDGGSGVPTTASAEPEPTFADWLVHPMGGADLVRLAESAERDLAQLHICHKYAQSLKRHTQSGTSLP